MSIFSFTDKKTAVVTMQQVHDVDNPTSLIARVTYKPLPGAAPFNGDDVSIEKWHLTDGSIVVTLTAK